MCGVVTTMVEMLHLLHALLHTCTWQKMKMDVVSIQLNQPIIHLQRTRDDESRRGPFRSISFTK